MEKGNRKKLAKAALLTASLAMGLTLGQSFFNEAQASGSAGMNCHYNKGWGDCLEKGRDCQCC